MRILIAAGIYPPDAGGPAVHAKAQFEGFPKMGAETGLIALAHYRVWPIGIRHLLYFLKLILVVPKYDVVYGHDAVGSGIPALIAARIFGKKFIVRIGGDIAWERKAETENVSMKEWYDSGAHKDRMFIMSRWLMRHADIIVLPSHMLRELYLKYYGIEESKIKIVLNPIPEVSDKVESQGKTIIWASRITAYKNLPSAFRALAQIFPDHNDLKFLVMGNGPEKNNLEKLAQELGINNNVIFIEDSTQEDVLKETAKCLFVLAPSLTEFNPNYVLQGIGFGKPFIISRENGLPFKVPETMMFNPKDEQELMVRISELLKEDNYKKAQDFVRSIDLKMSWDDNLRANKELISGLIKDKTR